MRRERGLEREAVLHARQNRAFLDELRDHAEQVPAIGEVTAGRQITL